MPMGEVKRAGAVLQKGERTRSVCDKARGTQAKKAREVGAEQ